jgi:Mitochondrial carrier protein
MQTNPTQFSGVFTSVTSILKHEGVTAFWKGAVPTAMGMAAENAMAFGVNAALKRAFPDPDKVDGGPPSLGKPFLIGALTGCCSALVLLPSEIVKAKLQVVVGNHVTATEIMQKMVRKQGYASYMTGLDAQLARDSSFYAVFFGGYELSCYLFRTYVPSMPEELNFFISGGLAGMLGWTCAMPFDVPKTVRKYCPAFVLFIFYVAMKSLLIHFVLYQNVQASYETKVVGSYLPEMFRIARERGVMGLYNGLGPVLVRAFPANAALFLGVEMGKRAFDNYIWKEKIIS